MPIDKDGNWRKATEEDLSTSEYVRKTKGERHTCSKCHKKRHRQYMHPTRRITRWAQREWECDDCNSDARTKKFKEKLEDNVQHDLDGLSESEKKLLNGSVEHEHWKKHYKGCDGCDLSELNLSCEVCKIFLRLRAEKESKLQESKEWPKHEEINAEDEEIVY